MEATFGDLQKRSEEIRRAISRNERVTLFDRGRPVAIIEPIANEASSVGKASEHWAFGMWADRDDLDDVSRRTRRIAP